MNTWMPLEYMAGEAIDAAATPACCDVCGQPHPEPLRPIPNSPDPDLVWCALCEWEASR